MHSVRICNDKVTSHKVDDQGVILLQDINQRHTIGKNYSLSYTIFYICYTGLQQYQYQPPYQRQRPISSHEFSRRT